MRSWSQDLNIGKIKEQVFKRDFLDYLNLGAIDVTNDKEQQKRDIDFLLIKQFLLRKILISL
jgi:hypothetical protein